VGTGVLRVGYRLHDPCISLLHPNPNLRPATSFIPSTPLKFSSTSSYLRIHSTPLKSSSISHTPSILPKSPSASNCLLILLKKALILSIRVLGFGCRPLEIPAWTAFLLLAFSFSLAERYGCDLWSSHGARQMSHRKLEGPRRTGHFSPQTRHSLGT
jgi:hypothetical protein